MRWAVVIVLAVSLWGWADPCQAEDPDLFADYFAASADHSETSVSETFVATPSFWRAPRPVFPLLNYRDDSPAPEQDDVENFRFFGSMAR